MKKKTKEYCETLAVLHGAKLTWLKNKRKNPHGYYIPGTNKIFVSKNCSERMIISIFCHELSHYLNFVNKKYYKYHAWTGKKYLRSFKTKHAAVRYALDAELYTDKMGRKFCKQNFPGVKFHASYKDDEKWYNYMYNKYFGAYIIILLDIFEKKA